MVDERVRKYYEDAKEILDSLGIEYGPVTDVTLNTRAKSRWGQCIYHKIDKSFEISISSILLKGDYRAIMDTMIHELLHAHIDRLSHTGEWKKCANLVNVTYGYNIKRTTTAAEKNIELNKITKYRYLVTCNKCGEVNKYTRKSKVIKLLMKNSKGSCVCGICGGNVFTLTTLKEGESKWQ